jgi:hypothetical protein
MPSYKVVGTAPILDHQPGETFTADLDPEQEAFLVAIGGLKRTQGEKPKVDPLPKSPVADLPEPAPIKNPSVPIPDGRDAERE